MGSWGSKDDREGNGEDEVLLGACAVEMIVNVGK